MFLERSDAVHAARPLPTRSVTRAPKDAARGSSGARILNSSAS